MHATRLGPVLGCPLRRQRLPLQQQQRRRCLVVGATRTATALWLPHRHIASAAAVATAATTATTATPPPAATTPPPSTATPCDVDTAATAQRRGSTNASTPPPRRSLYFRARWRYASLLRSTNLEDYYGYDDDSGTCVVYARTYHNATDDTTVTLIPVTHRAHPRFFAQVDLLCAQHESVLMEGRTPLLHAPYSTMVPPRTMPVRIHTHVHYPANPTTTTTTPPAPTCPATTMDDGDGDGDGDGGGGGQCQGAAKGRALLSTRTCTRSRSATPPGATDAVPGSSPSTADVAHRHQRPRQGGDILGAVAQRRRHDNGAESTTMTATRTATTMATRAHSDDDGSIVPTTIAAAPTTAAALYDAVGSGSSDALDTLRRTIYDDEDDSEGWEPIHTHEFLQPFSWGVRGSPYHTVIHAADRYDYEHLPWWFAVRHNVPLFGSLVREKHCLAMLHPLRERGYRTFAIPWGSAHAPVFHEMLCDNGFELTGVSSLILCNRIDGTVSDGEFHRVRRRLRWRIRAMMWAMVLSLLATMTMLVLAL